MKTIAILITALFATAALAQNPFSPGRFVDPYTLKVDVDLALFNVTVLDNKDRRVPGLGPGNFRVYEEGQPQEISFFRAEDVPATIGFVIDNSGSMGSRKERVVAAALSFAKSSNPADELFVIHFNERTAMGLPPDTEFTSSIDELNRALQVHPSGRTALYDALGTALQHLKRGRHQRKALVVLSDGEDNASTSTLSTALERVQQSSAMVYTVGIYNPGDKDKNPSVLKKIAKAGGGEAYFPQHPHELVEIWQKIAQGIRSQYTLGFTPTNPPAKEEYRRVTVVVTGKDGKALRARTREGYRTAGAVLP